MILLLLMSSFRFSGMYACSPNFGILQFMTSFREYLLHIISFFSPSSDSEFSMQYFSSYYLILAEAFLLSEEELIDSFLFRSLACLFDLDSLVDVDLVRSRWLFEMDFFLLLDLFSEGALFYLLGF